jgi:hypothetical protein
MLLPTRSMLFLCVQNLTAIPRTGASREGRKTSKRPFNSGFGWESCALLTSGDQRFQNRGELRSLKSTPLDGKNCTLFGI